ncbi:MAG TPA: ADP-ribosylation factor-like protein, partial [Polyangiaceae bacterium]
MPVVNPLARELVFKVVYYGPGLGGKTTSLQHIYATTRPEHRGKMVSLATPVDRTLYFDFLPIRLPTSRDLTVRLQLFTVPGQVYYNATRKLVLTGADGVVFVVDSQRARADANIESLRNLEENLLEHGRGLEEIPHVFSYNKRDLPGLVSIDDMERLLNAHGAPSFATVATSGEGVYETLEAITRAVLEDFEHRMPEHRGL